MKNNIIWLLCCAFTILSCNKNKGSEQEKDTLETAVLESIKTPSNLDSRLPRLFAHGDDLYFSWVSSQDSLDILRYSVLKDRNWSEPTMVVSGKDWFTNWADFPAIAVNGKGDVLTNILQKSANGTYTYDVKLNLYTKASDSWKKSFILHNDGTQSEHGFVSIRPYAANSFMVTWLDGRETVGKGHGGGQMTLRGALVFEDGTIDYDTLLDAKVCDCCQTGTVIGPNDQILVVYRDRSDEEIRDISLVQWTKEEGWSTPITLGNDQWKIAGCPVNGPSIDTFQNTVGVAWFTAAREEGEVQVVFSKDASKTFGNPIRLDAGNATGRVDITMISSREAAVIWLEPSGEEEVIRLMKVSVDGTLGTPIAITRTSAERASGFPQLEKVGDKLMVAWTIVDEKGSHIEMASIATSAL